MGPGTFALLRIEGERILRGRLRPFGMRDAGSRMRATAAAAAVAAIAVLVAWGWSRVLLATPSVAEAGADALALLLLGALLFDAGRRAAGVGRSAESLRLDRARALSGADAAAVAGYATLRAMGPALLAAWVVLLPVAARFGSTTERLGATLFVLAAVPIGHALGHVWTGGPRSARAAIVVAAVTLGGWAALAVIASDPSLGLGLENADVFELASLAWDVAPAAGLPLLALALATGLRTERWSMDRAGWDRAPRPAHTAAPLRGGATPPRSAFAAWTARDRRRATAWARRDWIVAAYVTLPTLLMFAAPLAVPESAGILTGRALPWFVLFALALPGLAFADGVSAGEPRALWAWHRAESSQPAHFLRARFLVVATGIAAFAGLLAALLAAGGHPLAGARFLGVGAASAVGGAGAGLWASVMALRLGWDSNPLGRYLRYAATLTGIAAPALAAAALSPAEAIPLGIAVGGAGLLLAEYAFLRTDFTAAA